MYTVDTNTFTQLYAVVSKKKRKKERQKEKEKKTETTTSVLQKLHDILMVIAN